MTRRALVLAACALPAAVALLGGCGAAGDMKALAASDSADVTDAPNQAGDVQRAGAADLPQRGPDGAGAGLADAGEFTDHLDSTATGGGDDEVDPGYPDASAPGDLQGTDAVPPVDPECVTETSGGVQEVLPDGSYCKSMQSCTQLGTCKAGHCEPEKKTCACTIDDDCPNVACGGEFSCLAGACVLTKACQCETDAGCPKAESVGFGPCVSFTCGMTETPASGPGCKAVVAVEGSACVAAGACGGKGTCKTGTCVVSEPCVGLPCKPEAIACGETRSLDLAAKPSDSSRYPCSPWIWDGGEAVLKLTSKVATKARVTLSLEVASTLASPVLLALPATGETCESSACGAAGSKIALDLGPDAGYVLVVESRKGGATAVVVQVSCDVCGNGQCESGESPAICPADCVAPGCGNGLCEAGETPTSCPVDCKASGLQCSAKATPGCGGCGCEACVCQALDYCCSLAWDEGCVEQCAECGGEPCDATCGDGACDGGLGEGPATCPADCTPEATCGDGACAAPETCSACPTDCGVCYVPVSPHVCGDGVCSKPAEHCGSCAIDCGACSPGCAPQSTPEEQGKLTQDVEPCVCTTSPACCTVAWTLECMQLAVGCGATCPASFCGDGVCGPGESCQGCPGDCGACTRGCGAYYGGGCQGCACEPCVVAALPSCASLWDDTCAALCEKPCDGCTIACGDGLCEVGETCVSCAGDCGACPAGCGDGVCAADETCAKCPADCGSCLAKSYCADGTCDATAGESSSTCKADCP